MDVRGMVGHPLARFFGVMMGVYVLWFVVYELWLLPDGRLDEWLSLSVVAWSGTLLGFVGYEFEVAERVLRQPGSPGVMVVNGCNGLEAFGLFAGFVLAYPGRWVRRMWFIPVGILALVVVNVMRVAFLAAIDPMVVLAGKSYAGIVFYVVVFGLWIAWAHFGGGVGGLRGGGGSGTGERGASGAVPSWSV